MILIRQSSRGPEILRFRDKAHGSSICPRNYYGNTVIFEISTFQIQKHFKTVTVTVKFGEINSTDFQDGNWESMEIKGVTADAKTVTVMVIK